MLPPIVDGPRSLRAPTNVRAAVVGTEGSAERLKARPFRWPTRGPNAASRIYATMRPGHTSEQKSPASAIDRGGSSSDVAVPEAACHAGGRGFESRRSRAIRPWKRGLFSCWQSLQIVVRARVWQELARRDSTEATSCVRCNGTTPGYRHSQAHSRLTLTRAVGAALIGSVRRPTARATAG